VRTSASTMMRKLSAASLTHRFARRSASSANLAQAETEDDDQLPHVNEFLDSLVSLNCDPPTPSRTGNTEGGQVQRLPIIRDEIERTSSNSSNSQVADGAPSNTGTIRRLDMTKVEAIWGDEKGFNVPSHRTASRLSSRQNTPSTCSMEAHNPCHGSDSMESSQEFLSPSKSSSRWTRVGAINRGLMALSNRSFFH
jgi:hypothetical protein